MSSLQAGPDQEAKFYLLSMHWSEIFLLVLSVCYKLEHLATLALTINGSILKTLKMKHLFNTEKKLFLMSMSQVRSMIEGSPEFGQDGKF